MGLSDPGIADPIASPEQTTVYSVEISDECGGIRRDTVTIFVEGDSLSLDLGDDTLLCEGQSMLLDAALPVAGNVVYAWSNGATVPALSVTGQGLYAVTVTVDDFCVASDKVAVSLLFLPNPLLPKDTLLCTGQSVEFDATVPGGSAYRWQDGSELPVLYANTAGVYSVEVTNACGKNSASVRVEIEECRQVYFPNAFSPNGDGINDVFLPFDSGDVEQVQSLEIFSRWGGEVFGAYRFLPNDFSQGWDGRKGGRKAPPGVYVWRAEVRFRNGVSKHLAGDVLLTR
jgi:gliding motility-associated-like protein